MTITLRPVNGPKLKIWIRSLDAPSRDRLASGVRSMSGKVRAVEGSTLDAEATAIRRERAGEAAQDLLRWVCSDAVVQVERRRFSTTPEDLYAVIAEDSNAMSALLVAVCQANGVWP